MVCYLLVFVGALNWGLVGLLNFNLVSTLLGFMPMAEKVVYVLVGLAAVVELLSHKQRCDTCKNM
jgi:uncharacterized membrane protein YuzA (DUF378 family)